MNAQIRADRLRDALAPASALVDEAKVRVSSDGVSITAVDPANVGMVDLTIDSAAFETFQADERVLGLGIDQLLDVLSLADGDAIVELVYDNQARKLQIAVDGLEYTLALIDPDAIRAEPDIPDLDLPATVVVEARDLDRAVTAADMVSDHIELGVVDATTFRAVANGDTDDVELTLAGDDLLSAMHDGDEPATSLFSLDYLNDIIGPIPADSEVSLRLGTEMPVKLRYSLADGDVSVLDMVAPRIQSQ